MWRSALVALAVLAAPAGAREAGAAAEGGNPVLAAIPLTAVTATGRHLFRVELARTGAEQEKGLMFRRHMAANAGMLFPFVPPRPATFWMENTVLPLDIVFIGADHRVLNVAANAKPFSRDMIPSAGDTAAVLELNAGEAAKIGLKAGDRVEWR